MQKLDSRRLNAQLTLTVLEDQHIQSLVIISTLAQQELKHKFSVKMDIMWIQSHLLMEALIFAKCVKQEHILFLIHKDVFHVQKVTYVMEELIQTSQIALHTIEVRFVQKVHTVLKDHTIASHAHLELTTNNSVQVSQNNAHSVQLALLMPTMVLKDALLVDNSPQVLKDHKCVHAQDKTEFTHLKTILVDANQALISNQVKVLVKGNQVTLQTVFQLCLIVVMELVKLELLLVNVFKKQIALKNAKVVKE